MGLSLVFLKACEEAACPAAKSPSAGFCSASPLRVCEGKTWAGEPWPERSFAGSEEGEIKPGLTLVCPGRLNTLWLLLSAPAGPQLKVCEDTTALAKLVCPWDPQTPLQTPHPGLGTRGIGETEAEGVWEGLCWADDAFGVCGRVREMFFTTLHNAPVCALEVPVAAPELPELRSARPNSRERVRSGLGPQQPHTGKTRLTSARLRDQEQSLEPLWPVGLMPVGGAGLGELRVGNLVSWGSLEIHEIVPAWKGWEKCPCWGRGLAAR